MTGCGESRGQPSTKPGLCGNWPSKWLCMHVCNFLCMHVCNFLYLIMFMFCILVQKLLKSWVGCL